MKRIVLIIPVLFLGLIPVFSYQPIVEPDTSFLPALLDSTFTYSWDPDSCKWINNYRNLYTYNYSGNLTEAKWYRWNSETETWDMNPLFCEYHFGCFGGGFLYNTYDPDGQLIEEVFCNSTDSLNNPIYTSRSVYAFDANGNQTEHSSFNWDSETNVWINFWKETWIYDVNKNHTEHSMFDWDPETTEWIERWKETWKYDTHGNQTGYSTFNWDSEAKEWIGDMKKTWTYDTIGNPMEYTRYWWDSSNDWFGTDRGTWEYDTLGNLKEHHDYDWDKEINEWIEDRRETWKYDANGNPTEYSDFGWDTETNEWIGYERQTRNFDDNGNQTEFICFWWNHETCEWIEDFRETWIYNTNGNQTEYTRYRWDPPDDWVEDDRETRKYDIHGNQIEHCDFDWDPETTEWIENWKETWNYDANGNQTEYSTFKWDPDSGNWIEDEWHTQAYDASGNLTEQIDSIWNSVIGGAMMNPIKHCLYWSSILSFPDQSFFVNENCSDSNIIGSLRTYREYEGESITFYFTGGGGENPFTLDSLSGEIKAINCSDLDYENRSSYHFTVEAHIKDSTRIMQARLNIYLNNLNDNAPVISDTTFYVDENIDAGAIIGQIIAIDPDGNLDPFSYVILSGSEDSTFAMDNNGWISLNESSVLDYNVQSTYTLSVMVSDGIFTDEAVITIKVNNPNIIHPVNMTSGNPVHVYPNPATDNLYIEASEESKEGFELELISAGGRVVLRQTGYIEQIKLAGFQKGIYFIKIITDKTIMTGKVMIQ